MHTPTIDLLRTLIAHPTVSRQPNAALIGEVRARLEAAGCVCEVVAHPDGTRMNLLASTGPADRAGVLLSGHTDVVPVEGQDWIFPPFELSVRDARLYGRGTADMKGFVASAVCAMERAATRPLRRPLQLALSFDEEIGCVGVRPLLDLLATRPVRPWLCLVGEPTGMGVATGHKGKAAYRVECTGREAHSALAPSGLNALHLGADFVQILRREQQSLAAKGPRDPDYDVPYSTVHVGTLAGGVALNIVPRQCTLEFEIRTVADDDPEAIAARLSAAAEELVAPYRDAFAEAAIRIERINAYPGLATPADAPAVQFVRSLTGANSTFKVAFGTEGGLFSEQLSIPVVICGPGSMAQGHKPDEYVSVAQLERCDVMLDTLIERLESKG